LFHYVMSTWPSLKKYLQNIKNCNLPSTTQLVEIGRYFLGKPYQSNLLEHKGNEKLICSLDKFDCFTFVETILALNCTNNRCALTRDTFLGKLKIIRYRNGIIDGYASRLHYTLDWLADNEKKKILHNITSGLPRAKKFKKEINFMSNNRKLYPPLTDLQTYETITLLEKNISRKKHFYIPEKDVSAALTQIDSGDIVAFTAQAEGLDIAHIGFATRVNNDLRLLHASQKEGGVIISAVSLREYLVQNNKFNGIIVARIEM
jgi:hypothetical protein